jgi:hypothetical protein
VKARLYFLAVLACLIGFALLSALQTMPLLSDSMFDGAD